MSKSRMQSDTRLLLPTLTIGTVGIWLALAVIWTDEVKLREVHNQAKFDAVMTSHQRPQPLDIELVSKPVRLYKPGERLSKSAAAVAKANNVAFLAVFDAGRAWR